MRNYLDYLIDLLAQIENDQKEHLEKNVKGELFVSALAGKVFENAYIDTTRQLKIIISRAYNDCKEITEEYLNAYDQ